jgi:hypothetical protein
MDNDQAGPLGVHHATGLLDRTRHGQAAAASPVILELPSEELEETIVPCYHHDA